MFFSGTLISPQRNCHYLRGNSLYIHQGLRIRSDCICSFPHFREEGEGEQTGLWCHLTCNFFLKLNSPAVTLCCPSGDVSLKYDTPAMEGRAVAKYDSNSGLFNEPEEPERGFERMGPGGVGMTNFHFCRLTFLHLAWLAAYSYELMVQDIRLYRQEGCREGKMYSI